ncbi:uncharacterized protein LY89DRAFT_782963 [Mollisia scopiformis]|uniref:Uncharacterized protein n=1 Tax=Mollisia scopiformis TaxID=149040 RepID=A0A194X784_MOLSC|nr:uncharacterized protein LY89DRAFT_782963 [Mollisia scopiformis]KUJ15682.1 hypothetical protein LY89DRAFT_782963 [Mollisia scopiformis]
MSSLVKQLLKLLSAIWLFSNTVAGVGRFTNPPGPDGALTLHIGQQYTIEWEYAENTYPELSLGLIAEANGNVFWLLSNEMNYTSQNYVWNPITLGNRITLAQGHTFNFLLVNGTKFGEQVLSPEFAITNTNTSSTSGAATATPTTLSTPTSSSSPSSSSSGLSTGAKAGIGVGVAVAVILALTALFFALRYRRRAKQNERMNKRRTSMWIVV